MRQYDVAVIGAGLLGCFTARNLRQYDISVALIEKCEDVCTGISKANTAVVYAGYDNRPGSLKAELCVRANKGFDRLCSQLEVPFSRCGSLMVSYGPEGDRALKRKLLHGIENGVEGLEIIDSDKAKQKEKALGDNITSALYAPTTGTVNPFELCIAAYENARDNGVEVYLNTEVAKVTENRIVFENGDEITAKIVIDCTGRNAGKLAYSKYYVDCDASDYIVIDKNSLGMPKMVVFEQSEQKCRGVTAVPTVEGSLLLGPTHRKEVIPGAVDPDGTDEIRDTVMKVLPELEMNVIRTFAATRPNPECIEDCDIHDFVIEEKGDFISLIGIKTPGLTCADEIGKYVSEKCALKLNAQKNKTFNPYRKKIVKAHGLPFEKRDELIKSNPDYGEIICICEDITKAEIIEAIRRGAVSAEGVKHRCGALMGKCQGSRCTQKIEKLLEEHRC